MLAELTIRNFAIIESVTIPFGPGFNVLTGETGAGKSILIDALGAVLGERVSNEMVRVGSRAASIDATFDIGQMANRDAVQRLLDELEIEPEDGALILSREIQAVGRSNARLNGRPTTASILGQIGALVVDIHGQSEHLSLLRPAAQLDLLDRFAQTVAERDALGGKLGELREARAALAEVVSGARDRIQRVDLLRYQVEEIGRANLTPGEEETLSAERSRLANADRLAREAATAYEALAGSEQSLARDGAMEALRDASRTLEEIAAVDAATRPLAERVSELLYTLEDVVAEVRAYRDSVEADPMRLAAVEERLAEVRQLTRKYGADIAAVLEHAQRAEAELERLTGSEVDAEALTARVEELECEVGSLAAALSAKRSARAEALAADVERAIAELNMGTAEFAVSLERSDDAHGVPVDQGGSVRRLAVDGTGIDRVTFLIAPNAGEGLKPLSKIASGGETARLMLALKSILSEADQTPTLVFDEIDVGVGGRSGQVVGEKLSALASGHQVIAITHLPQIAAFADNHFQIAKSEREGRVVSTVAELDDGERVDELAAMLDGMPISESARRSAEEMLERAASGKGQRAN